MTNIRLNKVHYPVTVLGHGRRIGIWMQGCRIRCSGCISMDTWDEHPDRFVPVTEVVNLCRAMCEDKLDGVTISGGEPMEQAGALRNLLACLREWTDSLPNPVDYLCYTGFPWKVVRKRFGGVVSLLDAIIPEPYAQRLPIKALRGSANQPLIALTDLGRQRYANVDERELGKRFQVQVDAESVWFIGIPERGDMDRLIQHCEANGLRLESVSWRA